MATSRRKSAGDDDGFAAPRPLRTGSGFPLPKENGLASQRNGRTPNSAYVGRAGGAAMAPVKEEGGSASRSASLAGRRSQSISAMEALKAANVQNVQNTTESPVKGSPRTKAADRGAPSLAAAGRTQSEGLKGIRSSLSIASSDDDTMSTTSASSSAPGQHRHRRRTKLESDEDGYHEKWDGQGKKELKSRAELLGIEKVRLPKAKVMHARKKDPTAFMEDDPDSQADRAQLEGLALDMSTGVTKNLKNVLRITQDTVSVGAETLDTLQKQGDQLVNIHDKAVELERSLTEGEKLLRKLGPLCSCGWRPKKGKKITGPKIVGTPSVKAPHSAERRGDMHGLGDLNGLKGNDIDKVRAQKAVQDEMLNDVRSSLDVMKNIALEMGSEMDRQDKQVDDLDEDVDELNSRLKQANKRGAKLLGKKDAK